MSNPSDDVSMGEQFNRRRLARQQQQVQPQSFSRSGNNNSNNNTTTSRSRSSGNNSSPINSQHSRSSYHNNNNNSNSQPSHRDISRGNSNNSHRGRYNAPPPRQQGKIVSLLESFGFIQAVDQGEDIFFHYSELNRNHNPEIGDEVEFDWKRQRSNNSGSGEKKAQAACNVDRIPQGTIVWDVKVDDEGIRRRGKVVKLPRADNRRGGGGDRGGDRGGGEGKISGIINPDMEHTWGKIRVETEDAEGQEEEKEEQVIYFQLQDYAFPEKDEGRKTALQQLSNSRSRGGGSQASGLGIGDLIEFVMVNNRRSGKLFGKEVTLIQSEKERLALEKEKRLLETATLERGVVLSLKKEHGYLRSPSHARPVYFHFSQVILPNDDDDDDDDEENKNTNCDDGDGDSGDDNKGKRNTAATTTKEYTLSPGQYMQFQVVRDDTLPDRVDMKWSARSVQFLSSLNSYEEKKKDIQFYEVMKDCATGRIVSLPEPKDANISNNTLKDYDFRGELGTPGIVSLLHPIKCMVECADGKEVVEEIITEIELYPEDVPCGYFPQNNHGDRGGRMDFRNKGKSQQQQTPMSWIKVGDILLFDVVREAYYRKQRGRSSSELSVQSAESERLNTCHRFRAHPILSQQQQDGKQHVPIQIQRLSLAGRAEGIVTHFKEDAGYGFIRFAERPVDVYFRLSDMLPKKIQLDLQHQSKNKQQNENASSGNGTIPIGTEVSFDLSLDSRAPSNGSQNHGQSRESLKASRIAITASPSGGEPHLMLFKTLAHDVKAVITKRHANGSGMLILCDGADDANSAAEVDESKKVFGMSCEERHPLVAQLLDEIIGNTAAGAHGKENGISQVVFSEVLPHIETQHITSMAEAKGLVVDFVGVAIDEGVQGKGRIRITNPTAGNSGDNNLVDLPPVIPSTSEESIPEVTNDSSNEEKKGRADSVSTAPTSTPNKLLRSPRKRRPKKQKPVSQVRFVPQNGSDHPEEGDVVTCDIIQSRTTGQTEAIHIKIVEKCKVERRTRGNSIVTIKQREVGGVDNKQHGGIVCELVVARRFGFIHLLDPNTGTKGEKIFFHLNDVKNKDMSQEGKQQNKQGGEGQSVHVENGDDAASSAHTQVVIINAEEMIQKGNEVCFDISVSKNGKRCAENIVILPPGTLHISNNRNGAGGGEKVVAQPCQGYVLMEPSHTSLGNTPTRQGNGFSKNIGSPSGGRWDNVTKVDMAKSVASSITEAGCILLLSDPSCLFGKKTGNPANRNNSCKGMVQEPSNTDVIVSDIIVNENGDTQESLTSPPATIYAPPTKASSSSSESEMRVTKTRSDTIDDGHHEESSAVGTHIPYRNNAPNDSYRGQRGRENDQTPRRGDLVSFLKCKKKGSANVKDLRVVKKAAATLIRGHVEEINLQKNVANFIVAENDQSKCGQHRFALELCEVVSCAAKVLKEKDPVEGILYEGALYGVSRTSDLYLQTKVGGGKQRPRLNLTVRKELRGLGGKIMAQSGMAKGPDGTNGFTDGWTKRVSKYALSEEDEEEVKKSCNEGEVNETNGDKVIEEAVDKEAC